jgi:hypothetical protein
MNVLGAIVAGLAATGVMTVMMYIAPRMGMPKMDMPRMLGTMFTSKEGTATALGMVIHLMMGAIFAIIYAWLWSLGLGSATWGWGLIFGAVHGIVAAMMMPVMLRMHPRPPDMSFGGLAIVGVLMAHLIYGLVVALVYAAF